MPRHITNLRSNSGPAPRSNTRPVLVFLALQSLTEAPDAFNAAVPPGGLTPARVSNCPADSRVAPIGPRRGELLAQPTGFSSLVAHCSYPLVVQITIPGIDGGRQGTHQTNGPYQ